MHTGKAHMQQQCMHQSLHALVHALIIIHLVTEVVEAVELFCHDYDYMWHPVSVKRFTQNISWCK